MARKRRSQELIQENVKKFKQYSVRESANESYEDYKHYSADELAALARPLFRTVNQTMKRLIESGEAEGTVVFENYWKDEGGKLSTKGKSQQELIEELTRARNIYYSAGGSLTKQKQMLKRVQEQLGSNELSKEDIKQYFNAFHRVEEARPDKINRMSRAEFSERAKKLLKQYKKGTITQEDMEDKLNFLLDEFESLMDEDDEELSEYWKNVAGR